MNSLNPFIIVLTILILILIFYNAKIKKTDLEIKDFTDEEGNVFIKLYKEKNSVVRYWETWNTNERSAVIHWGELGKRGEDIGISKPSKEAFKNEINKRINQKIKEGYQQIPSEEQYIVIIAFKLDNWGNSKDLENYLLRQKDQGSSRQISRKSN